MKLLKYFVLFLTIWIIDTRSLTSFEIKSTEKLSESICKIVNDDSSTTTDTQDILIANSGGKYFASTINDIARCVDGSNAVVVTNLRLKFLEKNLRKASVIVLAFHQIDMVCMV